MGRLKDHFKGKGLPANRAGKGDKTYPGKKNPELPQNFVRPFSKLKKKKEICFL